MKTLGLVLSWNYTLWKVFRLVSARNMFNILYRSGFNLTVPLGLVFKTAVLNFSTVRNRRKASLARASSEDW